MRNEFRSARAGAFGSTVVVLACAASAGAHAGLVPAHLRDEPRLGVAFLVAVVLLVSALIAVSLRPTDRRVLAAAAGLLLGLALAYLATRTTGIPVLDPEREAVDAVGVLTTSIEIAGVAFALWLAQPLGRGAGPVHVQEVTG
jgi:apolipoprotein N-acyltransferase